MEPAAEQTGTLVRVPSLEIAVPQQVFVAAQMAIAKLDVKRSSALALGLVTSHQMEAVAEQMDTNARTPASAIVALQQATVVTPMVIAKLVVKLRLELVLEPIFHQMEAVAERTVILVRIRDSGIVAVLQDGVVAPMDIAKPDAKPLLGRVLEPTFHQMEAAVELRDLLALARHSAPAVRPTDTAAAQQTIAVPHPVASPPMEPAQHPVFLQMDLVEPLALQSTPVPDLPLATVAVLAGTVAALPTIAEQPPGASRPTVLAQHRISPQMDLAEALQVIPARDQPLEPVAVRVDTVA